MSAQTHDKTVKISDREIGSAGKFYAIGNSFPPFIKRKVGLVSSELHREINLSLNDPLPHSHARGPKQTPPGEVPCHISNHTTKEKTCPMRSSQMVPQAPPLPMVLDGKV